MIGRWDVKTLGRYITAQHDRTRRAEGVAPYIQNSGLALLWRLIVCGLIPVVSALIRIRHQCEWSKRPGDPFVSDGIENFDTVVIPVTVLKSVDQILPKTNNRRGMQVARTNSLPRRGSVVELGTVESHFRYHARSISSLERKGNS